MGLSEKIRTLLEASESPLSVSQIEQSFDFEHTPAEITATVTTMNKSKRPLCVGTKPRASERGRKMIKVFSMEKVNQITDDVHIYKKTR